MIICLAVSLHLASAAQDLVVPPGFTIERVDAKVATRFPMFGALDDQGHLYVTESSGGDLYDELTRLKKTCRISRLTDTDGDGRYDESVVFADGLTPSMGLVWRNGKLFVADAPDLAVLEDTDGDGRADRRTVLLTGFGHTDNGSLHGLTFGPDGWLYFTMGNPDGFDLTGPDGSRAKSDTGGLIRCREDGSRVEVVALGFENLVEIDWLPDGSMIGTLNWYHLPERGIRDALVQLLEGGQYPLHASSRGGAPVDFRALLPSLADFPAVAHSGLMRYRGDGFPPEMRDDLFAAEFNTRKVVRHRLTPDGSSYRVESFDFITTDDPDVHFSDVLEDADGSLLVIDTGSWYVHHCPTGRIRNAPARGGIYRVRITGSAGKRETPDAIPLEADALKKRLVAGDPIEKAFAGRMLGRIGELSVQSRLVELLHSADRGLRMAAAEALAHCGDGTVVEPLLTALADDPDAHLEHGLIFALLRTASAEQLRAALARPSPRVQRAALVLLEQPPFQALTPEMVIERLFSQDAELADTARWALSRHPEWQEAGKRFFHELVLIESPTDADRLALERLMPGLATSAGGAKQVADFLAGRAQGVGPAQRLRLLETMGQADLPETPTAWTDAIRDLLHDPDSTLREQAVRAAGAMHLPEVETPLRALARASSEPASLRVAALRELVRRKPVLEMDEFDFLSSQLDKANDSSARLAAAETLLGAKLTDPEWGLLLEALHGDNVVPPLSVLGAIERQGLRSGNALGLLHYLDDCLKAGWSLPTENIEAMQKLLPAERKGDAQQLIDRLAATAARQRQRLDDLAPLLEGGDFQRGQALFFSKAICSTCHSVWGQGGRIGPDLTKIGSIRAGRDILESIVLPSATIAQGYDQLTVTMKNGGVVAGVRVGKGDDPLILRDAAGTETRYHRRDIESIERSKVSLMPEGLFNLLTEDETRDLLTYLQGLK